MRLQNNEYHTIAQDTSTTSGQVSGISVHTETTRQITHLDGTVETTVLDTDGHSGPWVRALRMSWVANRADADLTPMVYEVQRQAMVGSIVVSDTTEWRGLP